MAKTCLTRHFQHARGDAHGRMTAYQKQRTRHRVGDIVMPTWGMVDAVTPATRCAAFQAAELLVRPGDVQQLQLAGVQQRQGVR